MRRATRRAARVVGSASTATVALLGSLLVACGATGACAACGRGAAVGDASKGADAAAADAMARPAATDAVREELWRRAKRGDSGDLTRLADAEGVIGLVERGNADERATEGEPTKRSEETKGSRADSGRAEPATPPATTRLTAIRAMAFAPEPGALAGLPFLAEAARGADEAQAAAALESAIDLAARPRRAVDPEDAAEMKEGCDGMLALARDPKAARPRRVSAIRALRMLADRGCVDVQAIPADLDAR